MVARAEILGLIVLISLISPLAMQGAQASEGIDVLAYPRASSMLTLVDDTATNLEFMFGGYTESGWSDETWAYDYATGNWTEMYPETHPPAMSEYGMVFDSDENLIILYGGYLSSDPINASNETWIYDYGANNWTNMYPEHYPAGRSDLSMVYDTDESKVIIFGGYNSTLGILNETWEYDYTTNNWTQLYPEHHPSLRYNSGMAYDSQESKTLLFGGHVQSGLSNETWEYDYTTNNWTELFPETHPDEMMQMGMNYDYTDDLTFIFGGYTGVLVNETWAYDYETNNWTSLYPEVAPSERDYFGMCWVANDNILALFGGRIDLEGDVSDETWVYDYALNNWSMTAFPPLYNVTFYLSPNHGYINFNGNSYLNGENVSVRDGSYSISAHPSSGWQLDSWETEGSCSVAGSTATIGGDCNITANIERTRSGDDGGGGNGNGILPPTVNIIGTEVPTSYVAIAAVAGIGIVAYALLRRK